MKGEKNEISVGGMRYSHPLQRSARNYAFQNSPYLPIYLLRTSSQVRWCNAKPILDTCVVYTIARRPVPTWQFADLSVGPLSI